MSPQEWHWYLEDWAKREAKTRVPAAANSASKGGPGARWHPEGFLVEDYDDI